MGLRKVFEHWFDIRPRHAPAPPSYGEVSSSSEVHRREGNLASVQMKLVIFTLLNYSSGD
jgi:hypothetical protein